MIGWLLLALKQRRMDMEILEKRLGRNVDSIDADFVQWFRPTANAKSTVSALKP